MHRLIVLPMLFAAACAPRGESVESLIEKHTAARGGRGAIEAVERISIVFALQEPTFEVDGRYVADRTGRMRVDILADGRRVFTEAFDGSRGWQLEQDATSATPASAQGTVALRHGVESPFKLFGLHELAARGHRIDCCDDETLDGVRYHVLQVRFADGQVAGYYLSPKTLLIDRERRLRALHVDVDPTPILIETQHLDYRSVAGVMYPFRQIEREVASGRVLSTMVVESIKVNQAVDPAFFAAMGG